MLCDVYCVVCVVCCVVCCVLRGVPGDVCRVLRGV